MPLRVKVCDPQSKDRTLRQACDPRNSGGGGGGEWGQRAPLVTTGRGGSRAKVLKRGSCEPIGLIHAKTLRITPPNVNRLLHAVCTHE